jgi:hemolysin activation/secretion protein
MGDQLFDADDFQVVLLSQTARVYKLFDIDLPLIDYSSRHSFLLRVNSQFSEQFLPAVDRTALGGADGVRNLLADDISVDKGVFASMQFYWEVPASLDFEMAWARQRFSEFLRPFVFYDWAYGVTNASNVNAGARDDTWFEFGGYGLGMEFNLDRNAQGNYNVRGTLAWAFSEKSRFGDPIFETIIDDEDRIFFDLTVELDRTAFPGWFGSN